MKANDIKQEFIKLRAEGKSYSFIADKLHISKSTCSSWETQFSQEIAKLKAEELNALYDTYYMKKEARIKQLGNTLKSVEDALAKSDLSKTPIEKLLDIKLKYMEALQKEYIGTASPLPLEKNVTPNWIVKAFADLLERVRAGEVTAEQANRENLILNNLLKAHETVVLKEKIDKLESILESR